MAAKIMDRRSFLRIGAIAGATMFAGAAFAGCSSNEQQSTNQQTSNSTSSTAPAQSTSSAQQSADAPAASSLSSGKVLVAYYSAQGHTKRVAEAIANELSADTFEIVPEQVYTEGGLNWTNDSSRVSREHDDESLRDVPLAKTTPDGFADYDTVILGYPIWWAIAAWPIDRFVTDNDFTGKTVIPFCTSTSSGLGQSGKLLADAAKAGDWLDGERFSSSVSDDEVRTWARSL